MKKKVFRERRAEVFTPDKNAGVVEIKAIKPKKATKKAKKGE